MGTRPTVAPTRETVRNKPNAARRVPRCDDSHRFCVRVVKIILGSAGRLIENPLTDASVKWVKEKRLLQSRPVCFISSSSSCWVSLTPSAD